MPYIIVGLGNPGPQYEMTRHNAGRMMLSHILETHGEGSELALDKKLNALTATVAIGKEKAKLVAPETFMNKSGSSVKMLVKSVKAAENLVVIYDDFNLPIGRVKISFNRSSGGHNGLESIIKALKTEAFIRIRVGTAPENAKGNAKVPHGEEKIEKFILGKFKPDEIKTLKKVAKTCTEAVETIVKDGREKAMSLFNAD